MNNYELSFLEGDPICKSGDRVIGCCKKGKSPYLKINRLADELDNVKKESIKKILLETKDNYKNYKEEKKLIDQEPELEYTQHKIDTHLPADPKVPMQLLPEIREGKRDLLYVYAPSGCGKSVFCADYMDTFHKKFPDRKVFVISQLAEDKSLDRPYIKRIDVTSEEFFETGIDSYENSLMVFDDSEVIARTKEVKRIADHIDKLKDDMLQKGRHFNIYALITTHIACNYRKTKIVLTECNKYVVFPEGNPADNRYMLKTYGGLQDDKITQLMNEDTRWVVVHKMRPKFIMTQTKIELF